MLEMERKLRGNCGSVTVSLPKELRDALSLKKGDTIIWVIEGDRAVLKKA